MRAIIKLTGLTLVFAAFTLGGIARAKRYRQRVCALEKAKSLLLTLRHILVFTLAPPKQLLERLADDAMFSECDYLITARALSADERFRQAWLTGLDKSALPFQKEDIRLLSAVGDILGESDLATQCGQLDVLEGQLEAVISAARNECGGRQRLCATLGALSGLAAAVVLF